MYFTLYYRGDLKPNGKASDKHPIRQHFHTQLKELWQQLPLSNFTRLLAPPHDVGEISLIRAKHGFNFAPLVAESVGLVAELDVLMLWPAAPGHIISSGGDLDNRLKTLFDALKVPGEPNALPPGTVPTANQDPFYCLVEDDSLITRVGVETDRLLEAGVGRSEVVVTIRVTTRQLRVHAMTIGLA